MELGAFSISLAVKDIAASRAFYEKFGFKAFAGDAPATGDSNERPSRNRTLSRHVRREHSTIQFRLGQQLASSIRSQTFAIYSAN